MVVLRYWEDRSIEAFNAGNQESAATRATPALTMKELRTIALGPKWHELLK
ncbi:hypothetical protein [Streptomyces siamensis]|uniref:Uncharacterized protein n=1 Tax=Streptomyces siamensis TaxID=1274986 RepID=A0ABP9JF02_9ACTN